MVLLSLPSILIKNDDLDHGESGILRVIFSPKMGDYIGVELELNGVRLEDGHGKDVNINFAFDDFDDKGEFYTDSNGLEMQHRKLFAR